MANELQQLTTLNYADFSGGMATHAPATSLQDNEFQLIKNMEFNFNQLVTRGGLKRLGAFDGNCIALHYVEATKTYLLVVKEVAEAEEGTTTSEEDRTTLFAWHVWETEDSISRTQLGALSGTEKPVFCNFDGKVFIASGGNLQYVVFPNIINDVVVAAGSITTIQNSNLCDNVFERFGRLVTSCAGDDNLYYSAVGDPYETGWSFDTNDDSVSKWIEIGYKDDGDIIKALPIQSDLAIFKSNGRVYGLSGEYPNWNVSQIAEHTDALNKESISLIGSDIAFMTTLGVKSIATTSMYGNFTTNEPARRINKALAENVYKPRVYHLVRKRQLIIFPSIKTDADKKVCYCYQYDIGAATKLEFSVPIEDMQDTPNGTIILAGARMYRWSFDSATDDGTPIQQEIVTKKYTSSGRLFTRMVDIGVSGTVGGKVTMKWANKVISYTIPAKRRVINVFSVCRDSVFGISTTAKIAIDYIKLYIFEGQ